MDVKEASRKTWANKKKSCRKAKATKMRSQFKPNQNCQKQRRELQQNKNLKFVDRVQRRAEIAVWQTELDNEEGLNSHDIHRYQPVQTLNVEEPEPVRMQIQIPEPIQEPWWAEQWATVEEPGLAKLQIPVRLPIPVQLRRDDFHDSETQKLKHHTSKAM